MKPVMNMLTMILSMFVIKNWAQFKKDTGHMRPIFHYATAAACSILAAVVLLYSVDQLDDFIALFQ